LKDLHSLPTTLCLLLEILKIGNMCPHFTAIVKKAHLFIQNYDAILAQNGKMNNIIYVFRGKNYYEMKDVQEIQAGPIQNNKPENYEELVKEIPDMGEYLSE